MGNYNNKCGTEHQDDLSSEQINNNVSRLFSLKGGSNMNNGQNMGNLSEREIRRNINNLFALGGSSQNQNKYKYQKYDDELKKYIQTKKYQNGGDNLNNQDITDTFQRNERINNGLETGLDSFINNKIGEISSISLNVQTIGENSFNNFSSSPIGTFMDMRERNDDELENFAFSPSANRNMNGGGQSNIPSDISFKNGEKLDSDDEKFINENIFDSGLNLLPYYTATNTIDEENMESPYSKYRFN